MEKSQILFEEILEQEKTLIFKEFNSKTALDIGSMLVEKGKNLGEKIEIDISKFDQQLFHYSFDNTSNDNGQWIKRKNNVVKRFFKSSLHIGIKLKLENKTLEEKYLLSSMDYATYGGAFPIIINNSGVIGTITVSGLRQIEDHNLVVETIKEYLDTLTN